MSKSREQFEAEINKKFGDSIDQRICKNSDGDYIAWETQVAWWAWQASRAGIEIRLPEVTEKRWWSGWSKSFRYEAFWLEVRRVLVSKGLKVVNK